MARLPKPTGVEPGHSEERLEFLPGVAEKLRFYVDALVDPRDRRIFYVGKGKGDRVYQHARNARADVSDRLPRGSQNPIR